VIVFTGSGLAVPKEIRKDVVVKYMAALRTVLCTVQTMERAGAGGTR
jgi:hypothetical protein